MYQFYSVIIDLCISAPEHGKEVVYGISSNDNCHIYQLIYNFQLPGTNIFNPQMQMHNGNQNNGIILVKEFQKHLTSSTSRPEFQIPI